MTTTTTTTTSTCTGTSTSSNNNTIDIKANECNNNNDIKNTIDNDNTIQQLPTTATATTIEVSTTTSDKQEQEQEQQQQQVQFWEDDIWTNDEYKTIQKLLDQSATNCRIVSDLKKYRGKIITDTIAWDRFYTFHKNNFFKDRHYLQNDFPIEFSCTDTIISTTSTSTDSTYSSIDGITLQDDTTNNTTSNNNNSYNCLVEIGCGVGNTILPLLEEQDAAVTVSNKKKKWNMIGGIDLSSVAIDILKNDERYKKNQQQQEEQALEEDHLTNCYCCYCYVDVCDVSVLDSIPQQLRYVATVSSLFFTLSAIHPIYHWNVVQNTIKTLHPTIGGTIVFRDYGRYDEAQIKLAQQNNKLITIHSSQSTSTTTTSASATTTNTSINDESSTIHNNNNNNYIQQSDDTDLNEQQEQEQDHYSHFYRKHDGTKCYYFTVDDVRHLFHTLGGLEVLECCYIQRVYTNRLTNTSRRRVWIKGRFRLNASVPLL